MEWKLTQALLFVGRYHQSANTGSTFQLWTWTLITVVEASAPSWN